LIQQNMLDEGEKLFQAHGLKKVTITELSSAVSIAKGTFYAFYPDKEHMFLELVLRQQDKIVSELDDYLKKNRALSPRTLTRKLFLRALTLVNRYPLLRTMDLETTQSLERRLLPEDMASYASKEGDKYRLLDKYDVKFSCGLECATKILQTLVLDYWELGGNKEALETLKIMLDGVLKEIVIEPEN
jgi:AcrR family transcriptional regulator